MVTYNTASEENILILQGYQEFRNSLFKNGSKTIQVIIETVANNSEKTTLYFLNFVQRVVIWYLWNMHKSEDKMFMSHTFVKQKPDEILNNISFF